MKYDLRGSILSFGSRSFARFVHAEPLKEGQASSPPKMGVHGLSEKIVR